MCLLNYLLTYLLRLTKQFIQCLYESVKYHCHDDEAADFITTAVRLLYQTKMDFRNDSCTLGKDPGGVKLLRAAGSKKVVCYFHVEDGE